MPKTRGIRVQTTGSSDNGSRKARPFCYFLTFLAASFAYPYVALVLLEALSRNSRRSKVGGFGRVPQSRSKGLSRVGPIAAGLPALSPPPQACKRETKPLLRLALPGVWDARRLPYFFFFSVFGILWPDFTLNLKKPFKRDGENNSDHPHPPYLQKTGPQNMPYNGGLYGIKAG